MSGNIISFFLDANGDLRKISHVAPLAAADMLLVSRAAAYNARTIAEASVCPCAECAAAKSAAHSIDEHFRFLYAAEARRKGKPVPEHAREDGNDC